MEMENDKLEKMLMLSNQLIIEKKYEDAKKILDDYLKLALKSWHQSATQKYYTFKNLIEFYCAKYLLKIKKEIVFKKERIDSAYILLAYIAIEEHKFDLARQYLEISLAYNPINVSARFEIAESYKIEQDWSNMLNTANSLYNYILDVDDLARYYRLLGYYYIEMKNYNLAYSLYAISLYYKFDETARQELFYIKQLLHNDDFKLTTKEILTILKEHKIPLGLQEENLMSLLELLSDETMTPNMDQELLNYLIYNLDKLKKPIDPDKEIEGIDINKTSIKIDMEIANKLKPDNDDKKRAKLNNAILKKQKLPCYEDFNLVPLNSLVKLKTKDEILKEAIITFTIATIVNYALENMYDAIKNVIANLDMQLEVINLLTPNDVKLIEDITYKKVPEAVLNDLSWLYEEAAIYFWALGLIDKPNPNQEYNINKLNNLLLKSGGYQELAKKCNIQPLNEIMNFADLVFRYDFIIHNNDKKDYIKLLNPFVIIRQKRACEYLLSFTINDLLEDYANVTVQNNDFHFQFQKEKQINFKDIDSIKCPYDIFNLEIDKKVVRLIAEDKISETDFLKEYLEELEYNKQNGFQMLQEFEIKTSNLKTNVKVVIGTIKVKEKELIIVKYFFILNNHMVNIEVRLLELEDNYLNSKLNKSITAILKSIKELDIKED